MIEQDKVPTPEQPKLQQEAISAFACREKLSSSTRRKLSRAFGEEMSLKKAWQVVKAYAVGQMPEVGNAISQLTRAWLLLGTQKFDVIFRLVRVATMVRNGLRSFKTKIEEFMTLSRQELNRRLRQAHSIELEILRLVV